MGPERTFKRGSVEIELQNATLVSLIDSARATRAGGLAVGDANGSMTYSELWEAGRNAAGGFIQAGVAGGEVVITMLDNSVDYATVIVGLNFAGAVCVPTNTAYRGAILAHVIADSGATMAVVEASLLDQVMEASAGRLLTIVVRSGDAAESPVPGARVVPLHGVLAGPAADPVEAHPWDPFCIAYTSGTTGPSKGAWIPSAHAIINQAGAQYVHQTFGPDDVFLVVCPIFHVSGLLAGLIGAWRVGAYAHIVDRFHVSTFWKEADAVGATNTYLVGTMAEFLMRQPPSPDDARHSLRSVMMLPLHPEVERMAERFGLRVSTGYGNTETGCFIICADPEGIRRRSVGTLRPGFEVRLVDEHDMPVQPGEIGEVAVRPDQPWLCTTGYVGHPEKTIAAWRNGWFHTGDALRQDQDGYYYFFDRFTDAIRRRGENVSSFEVEREVLAHPDVAECAAVGVASDVMEQDILLAVVRAPGSSLREAELLRFLVPRLAYYMVPRYIAFVDELPKSPTLKVQKNRVRDAGVTGAWDREAAGISVTRRGA